MCIENGGTAFPIMPPCSSSGEKASGYPYPEPGMSLRDYFAAKAMQAGMTGATLPGLLENDSETIEAVKKAAIAFYAIADAMVVARSSST